MNKETAVDWLRKQIILNSKFRETKTGKISFTIGLSMLDKLQTEAKAMEEEQIKKAFHYLLNKLEEWKKSKNTTTKYLNLKNK